MPEKKTQKKPEKKGSKGIDFSFIKEQPRYVLYGAGLILTGVILLIIGLILL